MFPGGLCDSDAALCPLGVSADSRGDSTRSAQRDQVLYHTRSQKAAGVKGGLYIMA